MESQALGPETIVDGNNLMYTIDETRRLAIKSVEKGRAELTAMIKRYAEGKGLEVTVVYDGHARETSYERRDGPLRILLSEAPETADERILKLLRKDPDPTRLTIVTSDLKDIGHLAVSYGAKLVTSGRFADRIGGSRSPSRARARSGRTTRGKQPKVDDKKIEEWLELIKRQRRP
jgi:predicted RNA-binding protein with PIN domain